MAAGTLVVLVALLSACTEGERDRAGLAFTRYVRGDDMSVWVAAADGSEPRQIAEGAYAPTLSPDGRWLAYLVHRGVDEYPDLFVVALSGGERRRLGEIVEHAWSPDSTRLALSDRKTLSLLDLGSGSRRVLVRGEIWNVDFAPDGARLAYAEDNGKVGGDYRSDVFVIRLRNGKAKRLTHDGHSDYPVWGQGWIVYRSYHIDGDWSIGRLRVMQPNGKGDRVLARGNERVGQAQMGLRPMEFSNDGRRLLACAANEFSCPPVTFAFPNGDRHERFSETVRQLLGIQESAYAAGLARDGREVLVDVGRFDGRDNRRVYAIPFPGGAPRLLVRDATDPSWAG